MNIALWIVQGLLGFAFLMAGFAKLVQPYDKLQARMEWVNDFSPTIVKVIGAVEILGALGLVLPSVTGILPWLTPLAGAGLALDMLGAIGTHIRRHEVMPFVAVNLVLLILAALVAYGRFAIVPL